jgi:hypothetical protein
MSLDGMNDMISRLSLVVKRSVYPHLFRHTFTTELIRVCRALNLSEDDTNRRVCSANGWVSEMTIKQYMARLRQEERDEVMRRHQDEFF